MILNQYMKNMKISIVKCHLVWVVSYIDLVSLVQELQKKKTSSTSYFWRSLISCSKLSKKDRPVRPRVIQKGQKVDLRLQSSSGLFLFVLSSIHDMVVLAIPQETRRRQRSLAFVAGHSQVCEHAKSRFDNQTLPNNLRVRIPTHVMIVKLPCLCKIYREIAATTFRQAWSRHPNHPKWLSLRWILPLSHCW